MSLEELKFAHPLRPQPSRLLKAWIMLFSVAACLAVMGAAWELHQAHILRAISQARYVRGVQR